ncbi:MAG: YfgM family protein [bacterium]
MLEDANELEQGEEVKKWIKENISTMVMGIAIGLAGLYGWKNFQSGQLQKKLEASDHFVAVQEDLSNKNMDGVDAQLEVLNAQYDGTPYPALAGFIVAKQQFDSKQYDAAQKTLEQVIKQADSHVADLARIHLARVYFQQNDLNMAVQNLMEVKDKALSGVVAEIRGDIQLAKGNAEQAKTLYEQALEDLPAGSGNRQFLTMKLESLTS